MKLMKKISIFAIVAALLCSFFCISVFAKTELETENPLSINQEGFKIDIYCPECKEMGLVYDGEYFACQNKKCGYMYELNCSFCKGHEFVLLENGFFKCVVKAEDATDICGTVYTLSEVAENLHLAKKPEGLGERAQIVLEVFVTGMLSVFAVLALLWGIIALSKVFLHDIPNAKKNKNKKPVAPVAPAAPAPAIPDAVEATEEVDDGELVAVITAAVAAMIESGDYKNEFANGFRVVSFKRSAKNAWNRK